jgi:hypothetical protein
MRSAAKFDYEELGCNRLSSDIKKLSISLLYLKVNYFSWFITRNFTVLLLPSLTVL